MTSKRSYITLGAFQNDFFTYTTRVENFNTVGTLTPVGGSGCPKGRFLYENGRKLYPGTHPSITTYMVGVYDPVSFLSGFIDPNSKLFAPMNTDKSYVAQVTDAAAGIFGISPSSGVERDQGPGVLTLANSQFGANVDISGNLVVLGTTTLEDLTVNNLTIHGNATQIDITDMNSEQFSITNNGTGPALIVNQLGAQDIANFKDDGTSVLILKDGGNVGVGTTSPNYKLEVNGSFNALSIYQNGALLVPPGTLLMYIAASAPGGWLVCDGSAISRATYSALFTVLGTTYGSGDGANTFNLPDMRGRTPVGSGAGIGLTNRSLGATGGAETHTLSSSEMPAHTHTGTTDSNGAHTHSITDPGHTHTQTTINDDFNNSGGNPPGFSADSAGSMTWSNINSSTTGITVNSNGAHTHTFTTGSTGGSGAHNNMQPFIVVNYIIKY